MRHTPHHHTKKNQEQNMSKSDRIPTVSLRLTDDAQTREWLKALRDATNDTLAAGDDATRPLSKRVLSRAEAQRKLREAGDSIDALLTCAESALFVA